MNILHVPCYAIEDVKFESSTLAEGLKPAVRVGIFSSIQYDNQLESVAQALMSRGLTVITLGVVLGCSQANALRQEANVDCFLYVGSGRFHPLGVALKTEKPVHVLNPATGILDTITEDEKKRWHTKRKGAISRAIQANVFGILVSLKDGQYELERALEIKKSLEEKGRRAFILAGDQLNPESVLGLGVDALVNTACPRIADDHFDKPILNPGELEYL